MAYLSHHYEPDNNIELIRMQQRAKVLVIQDIRHRTTSPIFEQT
jgi:hypothetical protein